MKPSIKSVLASAILCTTINAYADDAATDFHYLEGKKTSAGEGYSGMQVYVFDKSIKKIGNKKVTAWVEMTSMSNSSQRMMMFNCKTNTYTVLKALVYFGGNSFIFNVPEADKQEEDVGSETNTELAKNYACKA